MTARKVWLAVRTPLTMLLLLAAVLGSAWWGYKALTTPIPPRPPDPCVVTQVGPEFKPEHTALRVFNGTSQNGLGKRVATNLRADGYNVIKITNAPAHVTGVQVVGVAADSPEVKLIMSYFKGATFTADPAMADHTVNITVGKDFKGYNKKPLTSIDLPDGSACLPPTRKSSDADG